MLDRYAPYNAPADLLYLRDLIVSRDPAVHDGAYMVSFPDITAPSALPDVTDELASDVGSRLNDVNKDDYFVRVSGVQLEVKNNKYTHRDDRFVLRTLFDYFSELKQLTKPRE